MVAQVIFVLFTLLVACGAINIDETTCEKKFSYKQICIIYNVDSPRCTYGLSKECVIDKIIYNNICADWICKVKKIEKSLF